MVFFNFGKLCIKGEGHQKWQQKAALACSVCGSRNYSKSVSEGKKKAIALKLTNFANTAINTRYIVKRSKEES